MYSLYSYKWFINPELSAFGLGFRLKDGYFCQMTEFSQAIEGKRAVVPLAVESLRDRILAVPSGQMIGSLPDLAKVLGVGIVTIQQAARVLEHEGLLEVRRGPNGGYYGRRPDAGSLERSLSAWMQGQPASWQEALDVTSLLFNELAAAAADCNDEALRNELRKFAKGLNIVDPDSNLPMREVDFQDLLFRMVDRPLFAMLTRVTLNLAGLDQRPSNFSSIIGAERWKTGRRLIIDAILRRDPGLARFEADRNNRQIILEYLQKP